MLYVQPRSQGLLRFQDGSRHVGAIMTFLPDFCSLSQILRELLSETPLSFEDKFGSQRVDNSTTAQRS